MSKTYMIKEGFEEAWKGKISSEKYQRFTTEGFIRISAINFPIFI